MKEIVQESELPQSKPICKKERNGRWSPAEVNLFESLLEKFGKNWKKIHEYMKGRTLSQIRSHAQKYFDKVGPKKVAQFERRAKLLEAYQILEEERLTLKTQTPFVETQFQNGLQQETFRNIRDQEPVLEFEATEEEDQKAETNQVQLKPSEIIKEQNYQTTFIQEAQSNISNAPEQEYYPFQSTHIQPNQGYLIYLMQNYRDAFMNNFEGCVDDPVFRAYSFKRNY